MGYEAGADDYITKPFSLSVLLLKIEAHFRRRQEKTEAEKMISGDIVFIAGEMKVLIKSREISLTKTESSDIDSDCIFIHKIPFKIKHIFQYLCF